MNTRETQKERYEEFAQELAHLRGRANVLGLHLAKRGAAYNADPTSRLKRRRYIAMILRRDRARRHYLTRRYEVEAYCISAARLDGPMRRTPRRRPSAPSRARPCRCRQARRQPQAEACASGGRAVAARACGCG
jgi:hypothetical protein